MDRTRHVWVRRDSRAYPGLVIDWRRVDDGWEALTTYVGRQDVVTTQWLPASELEPIRSQPYMGSQYG